MWLERVQKKCFLWQRERLRFEIRTSPRFDG